MFLNIRKHILSILVAWMLLKRKFRKITRSTICMDMYLNLLNWVCNSNITDGLITSYRSPVVQPYL